MIQGPHAGTTKFKTMETLPAGAKPGSGILMTDAQWKDVYENGGTSWPKDIVILDPWKAEFGDALRGILGGLADSLAMAREIADFAIECHDGLGAMFDLVTGRVERGLKRGGREAVYFVAGVGLGAGLWVARGMCMAGTKVTGEALKKLRLQFIKARADYWKREAAENAGKYGADDIARMQQGNPPIGPDGYPMELHHKQLLSEGGTNAFDNLVPMTRTEHRLGDNFRLNHPRR